MFELPQSTYIGKIISKDKIYSRSGANTMLRDLFAQQVERIRWLHKISSQTANIAVGETVEEIQVIEITLARLDPDKRILQAIHKAIPYKIVFVLIYGSNTTYTVYYDSKMSFSSNQPPKLQGNDMDSVWENIIVQIGGVVAKQGNTLDEQIAADEEREKLLRAIERLGNQAQKEKQPRRKWELVGELKKLQKILEDMR